MKQATLSLQTEPHPAILSKGGTSSLEITIGLSGDRGLTICKGDYFSVAIHQADGTAWDPATWTVSSALWSKSTDSSNPDIVYEGDTDLDFTSSQTLTLSVTPPENATTQVTLVLRAVSASGSFKSIPKTLPVTVSPPVAAGSAPVVAGVLEGGALIATAPGAAAIENTVHLFLANTGTTPLLAGSNGATVTVSVTNANVASVSCALFAEFSSALASVPKLGNGQFSQSFAAQAEVLGRRFVTLELRGLQVSPQQTVTVSVTVTGVTAAEKALHRTTTSVTLISLADFSLSVGLDTASASHRRFRVDTGGTITGCMVTSDAYGLKVPLSVTVRQGQKPIEDSLGILSLDWGTDESDLWDLQQTYTLNTQGPSSPTLYLRHALSHATIASATVRFNVLVAGPGVDLSNLDMTGQNLGTADLTGAILTGTNLSQANFATVLSLSGVKSGGITIAAGENQLPSLPENYKLYESAAQPATYFLVGPGVDLSGADLTNMHLTSSDLTGASLAGADLSRANLQHAATSGANLSGAKLVNANLRGWSVAQIAEAAGSGGANLSGAEVNSSLGLQMNPPLVLEYFKGSIGSATAVTITPPPGYTILCVGVRAGTAVSGLQSAYPTSTTVGSSWNVRLSQSGVNAEISGVALFDPYGLWDVSIASQKGNPHAIATVDSSCTLVGGGWHIEGDSTHLAGSLPVNTPSMGWKAICGGECTAYAVGLKPAHGTANWLGKAVTIRFPSGRNAQEEYLTLNTLSGTFLSGGGEGLVKGDHPFQMYDNGLSGTGTELRWSSRCSHYSLVYAMLVAGAIRLQGQRAEGWRDWAEFLSSPLQTGSFAVLSDKLYFASGAHADGFLYTTSLSDAESGAPWETKREQTNLQIGSAPSLAGSSALACAFLAPSSQDVYWARTGSPDSVWPTASIAASGSGFVSSFAPSIAAFNNGFYFAMVPDRHLHLASYKIDGTWSESYLQTGADGQAIQVGSAPAITAFKGSLYSLYIAFLANDGTNTLYVGSMTPGGIWTGPSKVLQIKMTSGCSLAASSDTLYCAFRAGDGKSLGIVATSDGTWSQNACHGYSQIGKGTDIVMASAPSIAVFGNYLYCAYMDVQSTTWIIRAQLASYDSLLQWSTPTRLM